MSKTGTFHVISGLTVISRILFFDRFWRFKKCFRVIFRVHWENRTKYLPRKHVIKHVAKNTSRAHSWMLKCSKSLCNVNAYWTCLTDGESHLPLGSIWFKNIQNAGNFASIFNEIKTLKIVPTYPTVGPDLVRRPIYENYYIRRILFRGSL